MPTEAFAKFEQIRREQEELERQGYYLPHIQTIGKGQRFRAVGSRVYWRAPSETFHEFLLVLLHVTLGSDWFARERRLPEDQQHFIARCWEKHKAWKARCAIPENQVTGGYAAVPDGWTRSLIALAADVYSLLYRGALFPRLLKRLKHHQQYQGARYELTVAGLFTRLGCTVDFLDRATAQPQSRHCEFFATHTATGVTIAVEAKSRHRPSVLHVPGTRDPNAIVPGDIGHQLEEAIDQAPGDRPFMVFIDVNAPMVLGDRSRRPAWVDDVEKLLDDRATASRDGPTAWNAIVVTNYSFHYATDHEALPAQYFIALSKTPAHPLPNSEFLGYLKTGLDNYGHVPNLE